MILKRCQPKNTSKTFVTSLGGERVSAILKYDAGE